MTLEEYTVVSAPGKVLIAGGYLVLEPAYPGVVISTTARFYTSIGRTGSSISTSVTSSPYRICVQSPQFIGAKWEYVIDFHEGDKCSVRQTKETFQDKSAGKNPFVAYAILYAVRLALEATSSMQVQQRLEQNGKGVLNAFVLADNDFYSQRQDKIAPTAEALRKLPAFNQLNTTIKEVHKTGLGSSAAMTTSLVGALLLYLGVVHADPSTGAINGDEALALVHNTAQLAHCAAQGKVGSGFDVSAAVWGSQLYRRFDKEAIQALLDAGESVGVEGEEATSSSTSLELAPFLDPRNRLWHPSPLSTGEKGKTNPTAVEGLASASNADENIVARPAPLELPPFVDMMLADVDAGSNTPSMVGKILAWRNSKPEWSQQMWTILASGNQTLADGLLALRLAHAQDSVEYLQAIQLASQYFSKDWDNVVKDHPSTTLTLLIEVRNAMRSIQGGMRALGRQADVPVEPDEMGNVIKATVDGAHAVVGGGVPGAGGYDALFVLFLNPPKTEKSQSIDSQTEIEGVWSHWKALSVGPLLSKAGGSAGVVSSADQVRSALLVQGAPQSLPLLNANPTSEAGGLRVHSFESVKGLREAIEKSTVR